VSDLYDHEEDWGENFDDMDSGDWENYIGGPDEKEIRQPSYPDSY
jgi:hypothetical protein